MNAPRLRTRKLDLRNGRVDLTHGSGGRAMAQLIGEIFRDAFDNDLLAQALEDLERARYAQPGRPHVERQWWRRFAALSARTAKAAHG